MGDRNYTKTELATIYMGRLMSWPHEKVEALFARSEQQIMNKLASILKEVGDEVDVNPGGWCEDDNRVAQIAIMQMREGVMRKFKAWYNRNGKLCNQASYDEHGERYYHALLGHDTSMSAAVYENLMKVNSHGSLKDAQPDRGRGKARFDIFRMLAKAK